MTTSICYDILKKRWIMDEINDLLKNFEIMPYSKTYKILTKNLDSKGKKGVLYVFAGPNGSGKSTLIANLYNQGYLSGARYLGTEIFVELNKSDSPREKKLKLANEFIASELKKAKSKNDAVVLETSLSKDDKFALIEKFKNYQVIIFFVNTNILGVNLSRVRQRLKEGGYDIPQDEVTQQYLNSKLNKQRMEKLSDEFYEINATDDRLKIVKTPTCYK